MRKETVLFGEIGVRKLLRLRTWHKSVLPQVRGFYVSRCLEALEIIGCLDILRSQGRLDIERFIQSPQAKKYDKRAIESVCEYLYSIGLFEKDGALYRLSRQGKKICGELHGYFHFIQAYGPIFYELPRLLKGEVKYGSDIQRDEVFVAKATAEVSEWLPLPVVRRILRERQLRRVLDLGCGRGELLLSLARESGASILRGIDIAAGSISEGQQRVKETDYSNRILLKTGDITRPDTFADWLRECDVVTLMFVLHEFVTEGERYLVNLLKTLKATAGPRTHLLIAETPRKSPMEIRRRPTSVAEHHLFHALSGQGILGPDQLRGIARQAGLEIVEDLHFDSFSQHYVLLK